MTPIKIKCSYSDTELPMCVSKFWGNPDLPKSFSFPTYKDEEGEESHYDFVCQIRCSDIAHYDKDNILPHQGMLYFFAQIGYYLGDIFFCEPMPSGWWPSNGVKVLYYPREDWENFEQLILLDDDDEEIAIREQKIEFQSIVKDFCEPLSQNGAYGNKQIDTPCHSDKDNFNHNAESITHSQCIKSDDNAELNNDSHNNSSNDRIFEHNSQLCFDSDNQDKTTSDDCCQDSFNDGHQLLGHPSYIADEIDPSEYALLLQVDSCDLSDGVTLNFMDWGMLYFLIPIEDLHKPSFKNVRGYLASS